MREPFEWQGRTRLVFGAGALAQVGAIAEELGARPLLVSDSGVLAAGHPARALRFLPGAALFTDTHENPDEDDVARCADAARAHGADLLIALGGGSALDTAKAALFLLAGGGKMREYRGSHTARGTLLPLIAIPTTAGTGSEVQSHALISHSETHVKMACGDPQATPRVAILDPELSLTCPPATVAQAGMDALSHALECAVTKAATPLSLSFAREAHRRIVPALERAFAEPSDLVARGELLIGATLAGLAIEGSMLGAAHALANPLTARYGVVHGSAVSLMLPHVMRYNAAEGAVAQNYRALGAPPEALIERFSALRTQAGMPAMLAECGVERGHLSALAREAAAQWTATFNPRPVGAGELQALYEAALGG